MNGHKWGGSYKSNDDGRNAPLAIKKEIEENQKFFYSNYTYNHIDPKRKAYYKEIKKICKRNNIKLYLFTTPLHPLLLQELKKHKETHQALDEFINFLSTFNHFVNFYEDKTFQNNIKQFHGVTHTTSHAGDKMMHKLLTKFR
jgi:hypothetical protein